MKARHFKRSWKKYTVPLLSTRMSTCMMKLQGQPAETILKANATTGHIIMNHYLDSDMLSAGMSKEDYTRFFEYGPSPQEKWKILEPWWLFIRNTGYGKAVEITIRELYGIPELSAATVNDLQQKYEGMVKPGFYKYILKDKANIQSCQVNHWPLLKSNMPDFLMSDMDASQLIDWPGNNKYAKRLIYM